MQNVVFDKPYEFVAPIHTDLWPSAIQLILKRYLRKKWSIASHDCRNVDALRKSIDAGHSIILAPNHCRVSDPMVLGFLVRQMGVHLYAMASWHVFMEDWFTSFMARRMGAFSVYREGTDRQAINTAIDLLVQAKRPLVIFPEGAVSRHNDKLMSLMDGVALIARTAAKRRQKQDPAHKTVIHTVGIRYFFRGDVEAAVCPTLDRLESRFAWRPKVNSPILRRVSRLAKAVLSLKEIEYLGDAQPGDVYDRAEQLIEKVLVPLEEEWNIKKRAKSVIERVKDLRTAILPDMVANKITDEERERRWQQLAACYYAQQLSHYPRDYVTMEAPSVDRLLETVERLTEDLTDEFITHGPLHVSLQVGEAIEVNIDADRREETQRIMSNMASDLQGILDELAKDSATFLPADSTS